MRQRWGQGVSFLLVLLFILGLPIASLSEGSVILDNALDYKAALSLLDAGEYQKALSIFIMLGAYMDSAKYVIYIQGVIALNEGRLEDAEIQFSVLRDRSFLDSEQMSAYVQARMEEAAENISAALALYQALDVLDSVTRQVELMLKVKEEDFTAEPEPASTPAPTPTTVPTSEPTPAPAASSNQEDQGIIFADPAFEAMLREALGRPEGPIWASELVGYTEMTIEGKRLMLRDEPYTTWFISEFTGEIKTLDDLQYFPALETLQIQGQPLDDLSQLSSLVGLTCLRLDFCNITDLTPLSGLERLTMLGLDGNKIIDLTPLSNFTELTFLSLASNIITDLMPLTDLTGLTVLFLGGNKIFDLTPLSELNDMITLWLGYNSIANLTPLMGLTELEELDLDHNRITNLAPLSGLTKLKTIYVVDNRITDWSPVQHVKNVVGRP